jgi:hypothetical protein
MHVYISALHGNVFLLKQKHANQVKLHNSLKGLIYRDLQAVDASGWGKRVRFVKTGVMN